VSETTPRLNVSKRAPPGKRPTVRTVFVKSRSEAGPELERPAPLTLRKWSRDLIEPPTARTKPPPRVSWPFERTSPRFDPTTVAS
jgi:hypothetical protein